MEKKTMGSFIAALRRSNGMTQSELAEQLGVTDKTVSRWETDTGMPDISLIPVIAEIFGITCDELLRGERKSASAEPVTVDSAEEPGLSRKAEKQLKHIVKKGMLWMRTMSIVSIGIAVLGLIATMILNFGFLKAYAGFYTGLVFFAAAVVTEAISIVKAVSSIDDEVMAPELTGEYRNGIIKLSMITFISIVTMAGTTIPLMSAYGPDMGIMLESCIELGSLTGGIALVLSLIISYIARNMLIKKELYSIPADKRESFLYNNRLIGRCALWLIIAAAATGLIHAGLVNDPWSLQKRTRFDDYESLKEYMETPEKKSRKYVDKYETWISDGMNYGYATEPAGIVPVSELEGETIYYDEYGNEISFEAAHTTTLRDSNQNIVATFLNLNENVSSMRYTPKDGTVLPVYVSTYDDLYDAKILCEILNVVFGLVYIVEIAVTAIVYTKKRRKN